VSVSVPKSTILIFLVYITTLLFMGLLSIHLLGKGLADAMPTAREFYFALGARDK